jgi:Ran GTPase-activating protein (RanGAP) involved in mRNA processing and transport
VVLYSEPASTFGGGLRQVLRHSRTLLSLELEACLLTDDGVSHLCRGLLDSSCSSLVDLNVSHNNIKEKGARAISDMLAGEKVVLRALSLASCHINDDGVEALTFSLRAGCNNYLRDLALPFNEIGNTGAIHLGNMLKNGSYLSVLNLQFNQFDSRGLAAIVDGLRNNYYLTELLVWNTACSQESVKQVEEVNHWLALNESGRRAIKNIQHGKSLWPCVLAHAGGIYGANAMFHLLSEAPQIMTDL